MLRYASALIASLICSSGVIACGGANPGASQDTDAPESSTTVPVTTAEVPATTEPPQPTVPTPTAPTTTATTPATAAQLVEEALSAFDQGDAEEAIAKATQAIELEPDDELLAWALVSRALAHEALGQSGPAVEDATHALELAPAVPLAAMALVVRASAHLGTGQSQAAIDDATTAIDLEPPNTGTLAGAYTVRAAAYNLLGRGADAIADATAAVELEPEDTRVLGEALLERSVAYYRLGRLEDVIADTTTATDLEYIDVEVLFYVHLIRALTFGQMDRFDDVVADATAALDLGPSPSAAAQIYGLRAEAFAETGRLDDAAADLELALLASPDVAPQVQQLRDKYGIPGPEAAGDQVALAAGETPLLAQQLVDVDGYNYVDVRTEELDYQLALINDYQTYIVGADLFDGASWHSVVADDPSQNTVSDIEVGFLLLVQGTEPLDHDHFVEHVRTFWLSGEPLAELDIGGADVLVFENPDKPDSRYFYTWVINEVGGVFDGADREPLERWLTAFLEQQ